MSIKAKQLTEKIKEYPKDIQIKNIIKIEDFEDSYLFETENSYFLIKQININNNENE